MKKAQSILEYLIMLTVIVGAILFSANGMQTRIQTARNGVADSVGNSFGLNASLIPIPAAQVGPIDPNDPPDPVSDATVLIPRSMYLTPSQLKLLDRWGIKQSGRSDYDPLDQRILTSGTLNADQLAAVAQIQREQDAARQRAQAG